jgi:hypothetical protein
MPGQYSPQGELSAINITKETTFGTKPGSPTWFGHAYRTLGGKTTIDDIARAPRASLMEPIPGTGGRTWAGTLDVEATEDRIPQLLAYTLGGQVGPTTTVYSSTLTATVATGATTLPVASALFVYNGLILTVGAETVTVTGVNGLNITTTPTATNHTSGVSVSCVGSGPNGKLIIMSPATPLPSFTMELVRVPSSSPGGPQSTDYLGCCIDQLTMSCAMKQGLQTKFSLVAQNDLSFQTAPSSVTLSSLNPYIYEQQFNFATVGGEVLSQGNAATLLSWQITINNNLNKSNFGFGYGNLVRSFPEQQRKVSGQFTLLFESFTQLANFNAAQAGGNLPGISALIPLVGTDKINNTVGGLPWALGIWLPNLKLRTLDIGDDTSKAITQTYAWSAGESTPGANDTVQVYAVGGNWSAIF